MPGTFKNITVVFLIILWPALSWSLPPDSIQNPDNNHTSYSPNYKARLIGVSVTSGALYAGSMVGLYHLWYANYPKSSFHFFNDCNEWMLLDKAGHVTSSYWVGRIGYESLRWSGVERKKAIWFGGTWGLLYLTTVEIFDGFSAEWGFSGCDMAANVIGTGLFIGQQLLWDHQPLTIKFSAHPTEYAGYRPDLLGENFVQQLLKDYNGQTCWLSLNLASLMPGNSRFPEWLNVSFGYGAEGMLGATSNPPAYQGEPLPYFERYSQYYFSLDIDPTKIKTNNDTVKWLLNLIGFIKLPFPALEFNRVDKVRWHWVYF